MKLPPATDIFHSFTDALTWIKGLIYAAFVYMGIEIEIFFILCILMVADTIFGSVVSFKEQSFRAKTLLWGMAEKMMLLTFPLLLALTAKAIGKDYTLLPDIFIGLMAGTEFISITGHLYFMKTGIKLKHIDIIALALLLVRKEFERLAKNILNSFNNDVDRNKDEEQQPS